MTELQKVQSPFLYTRLGAGLDVALKHLSLAAIAVLFFRRLAEGKKEIVAPIKNICV